MVLKTIQTGSLDLSSSETTKNVTITSIDTSKAYLVFNCLGNAGSSAISSFLRGKIVNSTTLTFDRYQTDSQAQTNIKWQVVEFVSGVTVQRGDQTLSDGENNNTITAVDTSKAWATVTEYGSNGGVYLATKNFATVKFSSTTNLRIVEKGTGNQYAHWQVIEMDQSSVQAIVDKSLDKSATSTTSTITSVTTGVTALMGSVYESSSSTNTGFDKMWTWYLSAATTVTWVREVSDGTLDWVGNIFVISFSGPIKGVQRGRESWGTSTNSVTPTLTAVTIANSQAWLNGEYGYILQTNNNEAFSERSIFNAVITTTTQLTISRAWHGGKNGQTPWEVTDFTATAHEPSVYDSSTVSENLTLSLPAADITSALNDTMTVSESVTVSMLLADVTPVETVTVSENVQVQLSIDISVSDTVTVSESISADDPLPGIMVYDDISTTEVLNLGSDVMPITIQVEDNVTVSEDIQMRKQLNSNFMPYFAAKGGTSGI